MKLTKGDGAHISNKETDGRDETIDFQPGLPITRLCGAFKKQWCTDPIPWRSWLNSSGLRPGHQLSFFQVLQVSLMSVKDESLFYSRVSAEGVDSNHHDSLYLSCRV